MTDWDDVIPEATKVPEDKAEEMTRKPQRKNNNWDRTYEPLRLPSDSLSVEGRQITFTSLGKLTEEKESFLRKIVERLDGLDFVWRLGADKRSPGEVLLTGLCQQHSSRHEFYLPWPKFADDVDKSRVVSERPPEDAYRIAAAVKQDFNSLSNGLKAIVARDVQRVLGKDCRHPVRFLLAWDKFGFEDSTRMKFTNNSHAFMITLAREYGIPVFNFQNDESIVKLSGLVKTITGAE